MEDDAICKAAWFLQTSFMDPILQNLSSLRSCFNQISSHIVTDIAQYSSSALDFATIFYLLLFQEMRLPPIRTQYHEVDLRSLGKPAHPTSVILYTQLDQRDLCSH